MKKNLFVTTFLACALGMASISVNAPIGVAAEANPNGWDYSIEPSSNPSDSLFESVWGMATYSQRLSERAVLLNQIPDYGYRSQHKDKFDLTTLSFTVEMSHQNNMLLVMLNTSSGGYLSEGGKVSMDILPAKTNTVDGTTNSYRVTLSNLSNKGNGNDHANSIEGFNDGTKWADDANFVGVTVSPADNRITVSFEVLNSSTTIVHLNDTQWTVSTSDLFYSYDRDGVDHDEPLYFAVGGFNSKAYEKVVFEKITDAAHEEYYSPTGVFNSVKSQLSELKDSSLTNSEEAAIYIAKYEEMIDTNWKALKSYDQAYLNEDYTVVSEKYTTAKTMDPTAAIKNRVAALNTALEDLSSIDAINNAITAVNNLQAAYDEVDGTALDSISKEYYDTIPGIISDAKAQIKTQAINFYEAAITSYESAVNGMVDAQTILIADQAYAAIPFAFEAYLDEETLAPLQARIEAAKATYSEKTKLNDSKVVQGAKAKVVKGSDGSLGVVSSGTSKYGAPESGSGLFFQEKLPSNDFEFVINISQLDNNNSWLSFGLMERPDVFINAENDSVTDNKGVFFLVTRETNTQLSVQTFVCSMTATRFYDSVLMTKVNIPFNEDVTVKMTNVTKELAGVLGNYFDISFNGVSIGENLTTSKMKTVFEDTKGYFNIHVDGTSVAYTLKSINGFAPLSSSLVPASKAPTATNKEVSIELGSTDDLVLDLDTKGQIISSIKLGKKNVSASNYNYENGQLTIKGSVLSSLAEGVTNLTVETAFGSVVYEITVNNSSNPGENPGGEPGDEEPGNTEEKKGCKGSIIATSAIISGLALAGVALVAFKKKEEK